MPAETLLQTFFTRLGFKADTSGLDQYKDKLVDLSSSLLKLSGVASLSLGGLFEFTRRALEPMAQVSKMSETYQIATDTLAAFGRMGREVGISTDGMMQSIGNLSQQMGAVAGPAAAKLRKLVEGYGLAVEDATGQTKDLRVFLGDVADRMTTMSAQEQVNLVAKLGLDPAAVRLLRNGREEFEKLYDTASKGLPFTEEDYAKAERFQIEFAQARGALGVLTSQIALKLMPMFQKAMESFLVWWRANGERVMKDVGAWVKRFADWGENVLTFMGRLARDTDLVSVAMKVLGAAVGIVVAAKLSGWIMTATQAFVKLAGAQALATWQLWLIVAVIAVLTGLILLLIDDFETWRKEGVSVIGTLVDYFKKAEGAMGKVRDVAKWVWEQLKSYWQWMAESWSEAWEQMKKTFAAWWPAIKVGLKVVGAVLLVAIAIVAALALGLAVLVAKITTWILKISEFFAALFTGEFGKARDMLAALGDWLWELIDKAGAWLREISGKAEAWLGAMLRKAWETVKNWFLGLLDSINAWIGEKAAIVIAAFVDIWNKLGETLKAMFVDSIIAMLKAVAGVLGQWWDTWAGRFEKVKSFLTGGAVKGGVGAEGYNPVTKTYEAPPILSPTPPAPAFAHGGGGYDASQLNSNNVTQNNTFNVGSMDEATEGAKKLQENARKQQQVAPFQVQPLTI